MADDDPRAAGVVDRTPVGDRSHPLHVFAGRLSAALDDLVGVSMLSLSPGETAETTLELTRALSRLRGLQLSTIAHAEVVDVAATVDATSTAAWLRSVVPVTGPGAVRDVKLASALGRDAHVPTAQALAEGRVLAEQAPVIVAAVDALPATVTVEERRKATEHLVDLARVHDARELRVLGRRVLEVVDPDAAEEHLARQLEAEEANAARTTSLTLVDDGHGATHGRFKLPTLVGEMLRTALQAIANPGRPDPIARTDRDGARRATPAVLGDAFVEYIQRFPSTGLPQTGGINATVVVTIPLETLEGRLAAGDLLGSRHQLSPGAGRRLACAAGVIPAVLDGDSRVLDLGRRTRTATPGQRLALAVQQHGTCGIQHCDRPTTWADAHHRRQRWTDGGRTDLPDLVLLCARHHTLTHLPGRTLVPQPGGRYRIQRT
jgi:hypothetical protein